MARKKQPSKQRRRSKRRPERARFALGLCALTLLAAGFFVWKVNKRRAPWISDVERVESHAAIIRQAAMEARVDPNLMAGIMLAESSGLVGAVSPVGALGLFQLNLETARERARLLRLPEPSREDLLRDPALNARLAAHYVAWLARRYSGKVEPMLVAYNAGPGRLAGWLKQNGSFEAWKAERQAAGNSDILRYVRKVERYRKEFRSRGIVAPEYDLPRLAQPDLDAEWTPASIGPPPVHDPRS